MPIAVEDDYRRLLRVREVRDTLDRIRKNGSKVECLTCDVRDVAALTACVEQTYRTFGRIDGVIHGAGVIEDKLVKDKALDSFDRVVETKVHGALALASSLRAESLKFLVLFSSISGRFGNRGQGDYAAANEILNKLAQDLDRRWPGRVAAINWGPWQTAGMASPDVLRQFAERGVSLIEVEDGCRRLLDEIRLGRKGDVEVLIGGAVSIAMPAVQSPPPAPVRPLPMLAKGAVASLDAGAARSHPDLRPAPRPLSRRPPDRRQAGAAVRRGDGADGRGRVGRPAGGPVPQAPRRPPDARGLARERRAQGAQGGGPARRDGRPAGRLRGPRSPGLVGRVPPPAPLPVARPAGEGARRRSRRRRGRAGAGLGPPAGRGRAAADGARRGVSRVAVPRPDLPGDRLGRRDRPGRLVGDPADLRAGRLPGDGGRLVAGRPGPRRLRAAGPARLGPAPLGHHHAAVDRQGLPPHRRRRVAAEERVAPDPPRDADRPPPPSRRSARRTTTSSRKTAGCSPSSPGPRPSAARR